MSGSSLSDGFPDDGTLEQALRTAVQRVYKSGRLEELTVKRIRKSAEGDLDLQEDFFKDDPTWKDKSKGVILSEVDAHTEINASSQQAASSPPAKKQSRPLPLPKPQDQHRKVHGTKRASSAKGGSKKRRKKNDSDNEGAETEARSEKLKPKAKKRSPSSSVSPPPDEEESAKVLSGLNGASNDDDVGAEQSESEMSELIDGPPKSKGRGCKSGSAKPKPKKTENSKVKKPTEQSTNPETDEIKKLQGWLVKCGIRKLWSKELAPYHTPKAKIRHLRDMLAEAGMTGRFSTEKANQIKKERELKADLEAIQEGNKQWGKSTSDEDGNTSRPRRGLARSLEGLDFLNDDGEETD